MKNCRKCGGCKPIESFYVHKHMADGHLNICKECISARIKKYTQENLEAIRAYKREYSLIKKRGGFKQKSKKQPRESYAQTKKLRAKYPEKNRARMTLARAIRSGGLLRHYLCERCSVLSIKVEAHHEDYTKPLEVKWLCKSCHGDRHREINEERRRAA